jgi:hypothetical protein
MQSGRIPPALLTCPGSVLPPTPWPGPFSEPLGRHRHQPRTQSSLVNYSQSVISRRLNLPLSRLVARLAQALQLARDERGPVALMWHDVIDHVRRRHDPALETELAQRMLHQLELTQAVASAQFYRNSPRNRVTANSRHERHPWPGSPTSMPHALPASSW